MKGESHMLDIKFIQDNRERVQRAADVRGLNVSVSELLMLDGKRLELLRQVEALRQQRNAHSGRIGQLLQAGQAAEAEVLKDAVRESNEMLTIHESQLADVQQQHEALMLQIPM
jgi:seryl-tRNA synthetase